jgi:hypothetical protein
MADAETSETSEVTETSEPVEKRVNKIEAALDGLRDVVDSIKDKVVGGATTTEETTEDDVEDDTTAPLETARQQETSMEAEVRAALSKIKEEEQHAADHAALAKKEPERAPRQLGKVTQALWGDRE